MTQKIISLIIACCFLATQLSANTSDSTLVDSTDTIITDSIPVFVDNYNYTLDSMLHEWFVQNTLQLDCQTDSSHIVLFPDSIYISRLQSLPYYMEMPFNSVVKSYIEMYAKRHKQVAYLLGVGHTYYFPMFEAALEKYGLPLELKYLPVIESALNPRATSPMGAAGLWQFMPRTGKEFGLEINSMVDERRNPMKSTDAAARYLSNLYKIYEDWHLVIAAYNCGPGNVAKAIRRAGGKRGYWDIYPYLPRETRGYVPIFIAANYIMNFHENHNMCSAEPTIEGLIDTIMVSDRVHFKQIADVANINIEELRFLNPQYRHDIIPGEFKAYPLVLPLKDINKYSNNRDSILSYMPELAKRQDKVKIAGYEYGGNGKVIYYKVKNGDYLGKIANKFGVKVSQIKRWNGMKGTFLRAGQKLKIYK